jgi:hypothetical protein
VQRYLVTFDLQGAQQPPGSLYTDICREIEATFGKKHFCRAFGQFCVVRSASPVGVVKNIVRGIINKKSNQFSSRDVVVFSVGRKIAIPGVLSIPALWVPFEGHTRSQVK